MTTLHLYSNYHIKSQVHNIHKGDYIFLEDNLSRKRWSLFFRYNEIDEASLDITYITQEEFFNLRNVTFNIVGNPPYQDSSKEGGQNKIYNLFCKKALELGKVVAMVTPTSVCEKSKRFSLLGLEGLKRVDFTTNNHFNVGVKICSWIVDKSYDGDVEVVYDDSTMTVAKGESIYDTVDPIINVYKRVMDLCQDTKKADNRMFKRNNHGPAFSPTESEQHCYPIYCNNRGNEYFVYTKRQPVFHKEQKLIISNTKALKDENIIVDDRDYGPSYFAYPVTTDVEIENIKSFVLSEYFVTLAQEFRRIRGGQNTVLIDYCPTFDVHKQWTNEEVKNFFENL